MRTDYILTYEGRPETPKDVPPMVEKTSLSGNSVDSILEAMRKFIVEKRRLGKKQSPRYLYRIVKIKKITTETVYCKTEDFS